ncbi:uncharacterized protein LOC141685728 [Apium graveolens]|uniref:uncharacterized protein LOC141685728 n=1 Tax=Apium graveolens TaxID=4045 RepID=UPI003D7948EB
MFDHQKLVYLPAAENDWANLRLQDFKSVRAYSSALFKISSRLIMCGEKVTKKRKIDKTLSTFHTNNINLAEMYRERKFTKFGDLLSTLLVAEQNHKLVIKNHQSRPTGSAPLPGVNNMSFQQNVRGKGYRGGRSQGRYRGRGRSHGHFHPYNNSGHRKWQSESQSKRKASRGGKTENVCYRCGMNGHWTLPHVHTQNGLAESFIKRLQLIARPLLLKAKLPTSIWGHAILHAANIIRIRPTSYNQHSPLQLVLGQVPNISHFKIFGCAVYVPIAPPQRSKMGAQRRIGIYVGFDSTSIIRYLEPLTGDLFTVRYADCHFNESMFPPLGGDKHSNKVNPDITWNASELYFLDPRIGQCELGVKRIIHMQNIANQMPDAFNDSRNITKSHIPAVNTPARIDIPIQKSNTKELVIELKPRLKRGRPVGAKDVAPRKRKIKKIAPEVAHAPEKVNTPEVSGRTWYNRLSRYLQKNGYIRTTTEVDKDVIYLKTEFEMKDRGRTKYCLGIQVEHLSSGIFLHQSTYTEKVLNRFYMDKSHPLTTPMVVRYLEPDKDIFRPREDDEEVLGPEIPYLGAIGALMYLTNNTRPYIVFAVNLLARFSSAPMDRHWNGIKHIFRYLSGTIDFGLFFPKNSTSQLIGYVDPGYLSDPHFGKSQTGYVFTYCGTAISWKSTKQTTVATSTNHSELIAIHEASRECVWLRSIIKNIQESCGLQDITRSPTVMFEDNTACIDQLKEGYIKGDRTKHISPKFFYTHELQKNGEIDVHQIRSCDNLVDLFTKSLPNLTFGKLRHNIGMRRLKDLLQ